MVFSVVGPFAFTRVMLDKEKRRKKDYPCSIILSREQVRNTANVGQSTELWRTASPDKMQDPDPKTEKG